MKAFIITFLLTGLVSGQTNQDRVRLEDIERDNLKTAQPQQQQQQQVQQYQSSPSFHYQAQPAPQPQYIQPQGQQLFAHPQYNPGQLSAYHQQLLFSQPQQPVYIPQHQALPFPIMLIPSPYHLIPQDVNSLLYQQNQAKYRPALPQQIQQIKPFRASPQLPYSPQYQQQQQYNAYQSLYQQKFPTGVKSTVSPPLKDNYVQQSNGFSYKQQ